jgi:hypothetical protein
MLFVAQMLSSLLKSVLLESVFSLPQSRVDFFKFVTVIIDLTQELVVVLLQLFVLVSLLWVQIVKFGFISKVDFLDLLLAALNLVFHVTFFAEKSVQVGSLLVVLVLNVHKEGLDVLWLSIRSMLVQR